MWYKKNCTIANQSQSDVLQPMQWQFDRSRSKDGGGRFNAINSAENFSYYLNLEKRYNIFIDLQGLLQNSNVKK